MRQSFSWLLAVSLLITGILLLPVGATFAGDPDIPQNGHDRNIHAAHHGMEVPGYERVDTEAEAGSRVLPDASLRTADPRSWWDIIDRWVIPMVVRAGH